MIKPLILQRPLQRSLDDYKSLNSMALARVLSGRDTGIDQTRLTLQQLLPPHLKGIDQAVELIHQVIAASKHIMIIGDYDVDGATSTALMVLALRAMGAQVNYLVPDRFKYGYGLTPEIVHLAALQRPDLLITVDNGISSHDGVQCCNKLGIPVIITDHHLTNQAVPPAAAVVNPNQQQCNFASKSLAGVGVAFYVLAALASYRKRLGECTVNLSQYLDLVALGTVADVAQLDFNNRILVHAGLERIRRKSCRPGILALLDIAGRSAEQLTAQDFGFILGPRINAAGRMDSMTVGIECLITDDFEQAKRSAQQLDQLNQERRQVEQRMRDQIDQEISRSFDHHYLPTAIVMYDQRWHQGVIGIVAGRLKEKYHRPSIVFAPDEDGQHLKGSARSIEGIHIRDCIETIAQQHPHLVKYFGGHAAAAGLTIPVSAFEPFKQHFIALIAAHHHDLFQAKIFTDGALSDHEFSLEFLAQLEQLGPFGQGFDPPVFEGIFHIEQWQWLKDQHLKLSLRLSNGQWIDALGFNLRHRVEEPQEKRVRLIYRLEENVFREESRLQLRIIYLENVSDQSDTTALSNPEVCSN